MRDGQFRPGAYCENPHFEVVRFDKLSDHRYLKVMPKAKKIFPGITEPKLHPKEHLR